MSIRFSVDRTAGYYTTVLKGTLDESDIRAAYTTFYSTPDWRPELDRLIDLSAADITGIPPEAFERLARRAAEMVTRNGRRQLRTALVVTGDGNRAQVEHYRGFAQPGPEEVALFSDRQDALRWLRGD